MAKSYFCEYLRREKATGEIDESPLPCPINAWTLEEAISRAKRDLERQHPGLELYAARIRETGLDKPWTIIFDPHGVYQDTPKT